jgi:hypothetical protein
VSRGSCPWPLRPIVCVLARSWCVPRITLAVPRGNMWNLETASVYADRQGDVADEFDLRVGQLDRRWDRQPFHSLEGAYFGRP